MCAMFKEVRSNSIKNSISASDSSLAENPIKAWAIPKIGDFVQKLAILNVPKNNRRFL